MLFRKCLLLVLNEKKNSFENNKNRELRLVANLPQTGLYECIITTQVETIFFALEQCKLL